MIYDGICPKLGCGGKLVEARGRRIPGGKFMPANDGYEIKTKCSKCGRLIGYRPIDCGTKERKWRRKDEEEQTIFDIAESAE